MYKGMYIGQVRIKRPIVDTATRRHNGHYANLAIAHYPLHTVHCTCVAVWRKIRARSYSCQPDGRGRAACVFFSQEERGHSYEIPIFFNLLSFNKKFVKNKCFSKMAPFLLGEKNTRAACESARTDVTQSKIVSKNCFISFQNVQNLYYFIVILNVGK